MKYRFNVNKINGLLGENKMAKKDYSSVIHSSVNTAKDKLNGKRDMRASEIVATANYFGCNPSIFFEEECAIGAHE